LKILTGILLFAIFSISFYSCSDSGSTVTNSPGNPLKGVYVLYEGTSGTADFAYFDVESSNVTNNVYASSNGGALMGVNPGDMQINSNRYLFITCRGQNNSDGRIYKIDVNNNHLINFITHGVNPYGFTINNSDLILSNLGANYVTRMDVNLNIIRDSIFTGPLPANVLYGFNRYIVCKSSLANEQSLAAINETTFDVTKYFFDFTPVSSTYNLYGYFVSSFNRKTIYRLDQEDFHKIDSIVIPTSYGYTGDIIKKTGSTFYVLGGNKELWEVKITNNQLTANIIIQQASGMSISGAAYEESRNEIYIADNNDGLINGELLVFNAANGEIKNTIPLGGKNPTKIAFKY
jgi:hypothetical protein